MRKFLQITVAVLVLAFIGFFGTIGAFYDDAVKIPKVSEEVESPAETEEPAETETILETVVTEEEVGEPVDLGEETGETEETSTEGEDPTEDTENTEKPEEIVFEDKALGDLMLEKLGVAGMRDNLGEATVRKIAIGILCALSIFEGFMLTRVFKPVKNTENTEKKPHKHGHRYFGRRRRPEPNPNAIEGYNVPRDSNRLKF